MSVGLILIWWPDVYSSGLLKPRLGRETRIPYAKGISRQIGLSLTRRLFANRIDGLRGPRRRHLGIQPGAEIRDHSHEQGLFIRWHRLGRNSLLGETRLYWTTVSMYLRHARHVAQKGDFRTTAMIIGAPSGREPFRNSGNATIPSVVVA
jgi:hypothetical protein